ncbi:hypothetical protein HYV70_05565 [Candidatus Uhrbacteria bacterium]|nr:hypothetical protein [Candidatus Uhrbacteria bacterium]
MHENQQKLLELAENKDLSKMSFREIARELDIENPQTVIYHLEQLKKKGLFYVDTKKQHRIAKPLAYVVDNLFNIPIVGSANCGPALEFAREDIEGFLKISQRSLGVSRPNGLIAVRAIGNSLNKADVEGESIENGDYVIVDTKKAPQDGNYVISIIDEAANFKRFYKDKAKHEIRLVSESTSPIPPIVLHEEDLNTSGYLVNGVVIKVVKNS